MTPIDIATPVSTIQGEGSLNTWTTYTSSYVGGQFKTDDANQIG